MRTIFFSMLILLSAMSFSQVPYNTAVPNGPTKKASVSEQVGLSPVLITYHRPSVNGREGKIWGGIVHKGFIDQGFGNGKPAPWRAGANENTLIEFPDDVKVEGQTLPKGLYALFIGYDPVESTVIFSKRTDAWGSFFYDPKDDALRVQVKPQALDKSIEYLTYAFTMPTQNSAVVTLSWEKLMIPFKVEVDYLKQQFNAFVMESQNPRGFTSQGLTIAANWSLKNKYQLEKGLEWATLAGSSNFPGNPTSFPALSAKAGILDNLGRSEEAATALKAALPFGTVGELQQFGRQLLTAKRTMAALEVFQYNYNKNPNQFSTTVGMVRGLSANGEYAKALDFAGKALPLAPNDANRSAVLAMIDKLKEGKDIN